MKFSPKSSFIIPLCFPLTMLYRDYFLNIVEEEEEEATKDEEEKELMREERGLVRMHRIKQFY